MLQLIHSVWVNLRGKTHGDEARNPKSLIVPHRSSSPTQYTRYPIVIYPIGSICFIFLLSSRIYICGGRLSFSKYSKNKNFDYEMIDNDNSTKNLSKLAESVGYHFPSIQNKKYLNTK